MVFLNEQRQSKRSIIKWPVSVWHPKASRFFNGRSVNVSKQGALVELPMKTPVQIGQFLEINMPRHEELSRIEGQDARIKKAKVIRIDRNDALESTLVKVGLEFV